MHRRAAGRPAAVGPRRHADYFLKIDDIKGESADAKHKNEIDVLTWSWGASSSNSSAVFDPFAWEQGMDASFVPLFLGRVNQTQFRDALLTVRRAGKEQQEFFKMNLSDAKVVSLSSQGSGDAILVKSAMSYDAIAMSYCPQKKDGTLDRCVTGNFTLDNSKLNFSGDPSVRQGLVEAGGPLDFVNQVPEPATWASLAAGLGVVAALVRLRRQTARPGRPMPPGPAG